MNLVGQRVLLTGASSGIGRATAIALAARGARLCLVARRGGRLRQLRDELLDAGASAVVCEIDLTGEGAAATAVQACVDGLGGLDILINNAGHGAYLPTLAVTPELARSLFELNVIVPLRLMQAAVPHMSSRCGGIIVNIGSNAARMGRPKVGVYAASKAALEAISVAARAELAPQGIRVLTVSPGRTVSEFGQRALRQGHSKPGPAGGLSPGGGRPDTAEFVADRIAATIEQEAMWTAAPLQGDTSRDEPRGWDTLEA